MPYWYYDKEALLNTPSIQDGIDYNTEYRYRKEGAQLIINIGIQMDLGYNTAATGVVFFHRFYMFHSFKTFPRYVTACCCLFLAGKVEETPKKCKDIIKVAKSLLSEEKFLSFGEDPKEEVMTLENILLQTMKFDLKVVHPYSFLLKYAKCLKGDKHKLHKMVQMAWTFVNDSFCTTLSIQWEPEIIAIAIMYLAGKLTKFKVISWSDQKPYHLRWWDMFVRDLSMDVLEDICHQVLDLYSPAKNIEPPISSPVEQLTKTTNNEKQLKPTKSALSSTKDPRLQSEFNTVKNKSQKEVADISNTVSSSIFSSANSSLNYSNQSMNHKNYGQINDNPFRINQDCKTSNISQTTMIIYQHVIKTLTILKMINLLHTTTIIKGIIIQIT